MLGGLISTIAGEWKAWNTAFKELPDNPLAKYFALMRKRRLAKLSWFKRNRLLLLGGCISVPIAFSSLMMFLMYLVGLDSSYQQDAAYLLLQSGSGLAFAFSVIVFFWLIPLLFNSLHSALAFLGIQGQKDTGEKFDDLIGGSTLSDRELGAAVVSYNFGLLAKPIITLTLIRQISSVLHSASYDFLMQGIGSVGMGYGYDYEQTIIEWGLKEQVLQVLLELPVWKLKLVTLPFDAVYSLVANLLGALLFIVIFVVLGRNLRHTAAIPATVFLSIFWIMISGLAFSSGFSILQMGFPMGFPLPFSNQIQGMLVGSLGVPCLCLLVLILFLRRTGVGTSILLLTGLVFFPLLVGVGFSLLGFNIAFQNPYSPYSTDSTLMLINEVSWGSMAFSPLNPVGVLPEMAWGMNHFSVGRFPWHELLRAPILILVQLLTLAGLSPILLKAISLRRQGQG